MYFKINSIKNIFNYLHCHFEQKLKEYSFKNEKCTINLFLELITNFNNFNN